MSSGYDYDVIVFGGAPPASTAPAWPRGPACRRRRARAGRRRVLVLGLHSVQVPAAPGRGGARRPEAGASAEVDVQAALDWRDYMVSNYSDAGQERWLADRGIDLLRGRVGLPDWVGRGGGDRPPPTTSCWPPAPIRLCRRSPGSGNWRVWGTRDATRMKAVPTAAGAGRWRSRGRARPGRASPRGNGGVVEGADRVLSREPAPLGEALSEDLRRDGIELMLGMHATAACQDGGIMYLRVRRRPRASRRPATCVNR